MPTSSVVGRIAAVLALIGAGIVVLLLLAGGGSSYTVTGKFENASQLVKGNTVNVAGVAVGSIKEIKLADDGQALVKMEVSDESYTPLPQGTHATVRSQSLSGIANRYVDLSLPAEEEGDPIDSGGTIEQLNTTSEVDLDQLFNTFNAKTVASLKSVIKGFAQSYDGVGPQANKGFYYLNPFLSTSRRVFGELNADKAALESLLIDTSSLTGALTTRSADIEALIGNIDQAFGAIGRQEIALANSIGQLPDFMRQFNTTAVNLRAALDDVDPLVDASRPVARQLKPFTRRLRGFARDSVPTVKSLDSIVRRTGVDNDLVELTQLQDPLAEIGAGPAVRNGESREGALPESARALGPGSGGELGGLDQLIFFRPYITEDAISGWFDDFSHSGFGDSIGGIGRINATLNTFTPSAIPGGAPIFDLVGAGGNPLAELTALGPGNFVGNNERCPGANVTGNQLTPAEDNQLQYLDDPYQELDGTPGLDCNPAQTLPGIP